MPHLAVKCVTAVGCNAMQGGKGATGGRQAKKECYARGGKLRRCHSNRLQDCVDITLQVTFEDIPATAAKLNRRM